MTEIPVEKKSGLPRWVYLLGALAIAGILIGLLVTRDRDDNQRAATGAAAGAGAPAGTGAAAGTASVNELSSLRARDAQALVGREIDLRDAEVVRVIGDRVFTVGSQGSEIFVRLDAPLDRGAAEQNVQVKAGQHLGLAGVVQRSPEAGGTEGWQGLSEADLAALRKQPVYVLARRIAGAR